MGYRRMAKGLALASLMALSFGAPSEALIESHEIPSFKVGTTALVTPSTAWAYYQTLNMTSSVRDPDYWDLIPNLARALQHDPDLIYTFVRDNVEVEFMFGLQKGARGAALDKWGTPFDQAHLMVELLRESGITARYKFGEISLSGAEFDDWTGITNKAAAEEYLANGGIPATVSGTGTVSTVVLMHLWVEADLPGEGTFQFDPSLKRYSEVASVDLGAKMGFNGASFLATASSGMTADTVSNTPRVRDVNRTGIQSTMQTYATTLLNNFRANHSTDAIENVIGGREIVAETTVPRNTVHPNQSNLRATFINDVPPALRTVVSISFVDFFADVIYGEPIGYNFFPPNMPEGLPEWTGGPYSCVHPFVGRHALVDANGDPLCTSVYQFAYGFEIDHPYAGTDAETGTVGKYMDEDVYFRNAGDPGGFYNYNSYVILGFGHRGPEAGERAEKTMVQKGHKVPHTFICEGPNPEGCTEMATDVMDPTQRQLANAWLVQQSRSSDIIEQVGGTRHQHHHSIGMTSLFLVTNGLQVPEAQSLKIDVSTSLSVTHLNDVAADRQAAIEILAVSASTLEGSLGEQIQDTPDPVSVAAKFDWNNSSNVGTAGHRWFYLANSANWAYVDSQILNDGLNDDQTKLYAKFFVDQGYSVVIPRKTNLGPGVKDYNDPNSSPNPEGVARGAAFIAMAPANDAFAYSIVRANSFAKGGGGASGFGRYEIFKGPKDFEENQFELYSQWADVNLQDGSLTIAFPPDITTGEGNYPYSLSMQRTYKSSGGGSAEFGTTDIGSYGTLPNPGIHWSEPGGWYHNLRHTLGISGSGMEAMGASHLYNAADTLVAFKVLFELYKTSSSDLDRLKRVVFGAHAAKWWSDQLTYNNVTISSGADTQAFFRLADGTFNPQVGSNAVLTQTGDRFVTTNNNDKKDMWVYESVSFDMVSDAGVKHEFDSRDWERPWSSPAPGDLFLLKKQSFPTGVTVDFTYTVVDLIVDAPGAMLEKVTTSLGRELTFNYQSAAGAMISVEDTSTGVTPGSRVVSYSGGGYLTGVTNALGQTTTYDYVTLGVKAWGIPQPRILSSIYLPSDPVNPFLSFEYAEDRRLHKIINAEGDATEYFIGGGRYGAVRNALGELSETWYNAKGQAFMSADAMGRISTTDYDSLGRAIRSTAPGGEYSESDYDAWNNVIATRAYPRAGSGESVITTTTDYTTKSGPYGIIRGLVSKETDALGFETTYSYNSKGQVLSVTQPLVDTTGNGTPDTAPVTTMTYDAINGLPLTSIAPDGLKTVNTYSTTGFLGTVTLDPLGFNIAWQLTHDGVGNVTQGIDPKGNVYVATYDKLRRMEQSDAPLSGQTKWTYDVDGLITSIDVAKNAGHTLWSTTSYTYHPTKRVKTITDPEGNVTTRGYDALSRPDVTTDAEGRRVKTVYDAAGQVTQIYRAWRSGIPDGAADIFSCDTAVVRAAHPGALQQCYQRYTYDALTAEMTSVMDAKGNATTYTYDGHGRALRTTFADATYEEVTLYDASGQVQERRNRAGKSIEYDFDALGRETLQRISSGRNLLTFYDLAGRVTTHRRQNRSNGNQFTPFDYVYDSVGRLTERRYGGTWQTKYVYDANFNRTNLTHADGFFVSYAYDELNRMAGACKGETASYALATGVSCSGATAPLAEYAYNVQSQRTGATLGNGNTIDYTYHADGALKNLEHIFEAGQPSSTDVKYTFGFNKVNQMTSKTLTNGLFGWLPGAAATEVYGAANTLNQYPTIDGAALTYDLNGNLKSDGTDTYVYDTYRNELTQVTKGGGTVVNLSYNPMGALNQKKVDGVLVERYLMDGDHVVADYTGSNQKMAGSEVLRRYIYGPGVDERIAMIDETGASPVTTWYHTDHQGSVIGMSDATGTRHETYTYDEFGNSDTLTGNPYRYTGRRLDAETGLYYYRARYYAPAIGRFLQTDPIGYQDQMNLYAYVGNDPVNLIDPTGQNAWDFNRGMGSVTKGNNALMIHRAAVNGKGSPAEVARANFVRNAMDAGAMVALNNPGTAMKLIIDKTVETMGEESGRHFMAGRSAQSMLVGAYGTKGLGGLLGLAGKGASFSMVQYGGAIRTLNQTFDQLTAAGIDSGILSSDTLGQIAIAGAAGLDVGYDANSNLLTVSGSISRTGSHIKIKVKAEIELDKEAEEESK